MSAAVNYNNIPTALLVADKIMHQNTSIINNNKSLQRLLSFKQLYFP